jgi:hypothetical protein
MRGVDRVARSPILCNHVGVLEQSRLRRRDRIAPARVSLALVMLSKSERRRSEDTRRHMSGQIWSGTSCQGELSAFGCGLAARSSLLEIALLFGSSAFDAISCSLLEARTSSIADRAVRRCAVWRHRELQNRAVERRAVKSRRQMAHAIVICRCPNRAVAVSCRGGLVGSRGSLTLASRSSNARLRPFDQGSPAVTNRAAKLHIGWAITSHASFSQPRGAKSQEACRVFDGEERRSVLSSQCEK